MDDGVIGLDHAAVVRTWNQAAERMWGLRSEQVLGREVFTLALGEFGRRLRTAFDAMVETGEAQRLASVAYSLPGASELHASVRIAPVKDVTGNVIGGVATASPNSA
jgi:PAS domain S-box-containing protein